MIETATRWTFDTLAEASRKELERVLMTGRAPDPEQLEGWIYCGWNHEWVGRLSGEKFKKGFRRRDGRPFGYNEIVEQDNRGHGGEWKVKMKDGRPRQLGYFRVGLTADEPEDSLNRPYRHTGHLNYHVPANTWLNLPFRVIRDFAVLPNPDDHELILCKAYFTLGPAWLRIFYCYFLLGHRQKIEFEPW